MSQKTRPGGYYSKAALCELLGISRNGYYKHEERETEFGILVTSVVMYCRWVRLDDHLPKSGCRELLILCREYFGDKFKIGRDRFYDVLRANGMMLRLYCTEDAEISFSLEKFLYSLENLYICIKIPQT